MRRYSLLFALAAQVLMAPKCVPEDERLTQREVTSPVEAETSDRPVIANPCPEPDTAELLIQNFSFIIVCGCVEAPWPMEQDGSRTCTIPTGTRVRWTFADSEDHNVVSTAGAFDESGDHLVGTHEHVFGSPGTHTYRCGLHPRDMSGYSIVVR